MNSPLFLGYCRRPSQTAPEQERREPNGAAGRPAQRPAEIELRIANSPRLVLVQGGCQTEEATYRRPPKIPGCDNRDKIFQP